jgi:A/G-specific adenine glycosylase
LFPTVHRLAQANQQDVLKCWEGLGYYARARNLFRAANIVVNFHDGKIPADYKTFLGLPGVGPYIAAAVLSIAFGHPYAVVDGNVKRVLSRFACIDAPVNLSTSHKVFATLAKDLLDEVRPATFNQAMMELGALICKPERPVCESCPIVKDCAAAKKKRVDRYPVRSKVKPVPTHPVAVGVVLRGKKLLITRRRPDGLLGGLWEFPGGKVQPGEKPVDTCKREIREETGLEIEITKVLTTVRHAYTHFKIKMTVFIGRCLSGTVVLNGPIDYRWVSFEALNQYPFPKANHKFFPALQSFLENAFE